MLRRREVILAKLETTYRVDPTPLPSNAVFVNNLQYSNNARQNPRPGVKLTMGPLQQIFGGRTVQLTFECEIKGSGTIDVAPELGPLFQICGLLETVNTAASVVYTPSSSGTKSATIYYYQDGKLKKLHGCVGNMEIDAKSGEIPMVKFTITGHPGTETDTALPSPTYDTTVPPIFVNAGVSIGGYSPVLSQLNLNMNNVIGIPPDVNQANGWGQIRITDRDPAGTVDPEDTLIAAVNWYEVWEDGTKAPINTGTIGSTEGNRWRLQMPACVFRGIDEGEREGISVISINFGALETAGDDQLTLTFT